MPFVSLKLYIFECSYRIFFLEALLSSAILTNNHLVFGKMKILTIFLIGKIFGLKQPGNFVPAWDKLERRTAWTVELYPYTFDCYTHVVENTWFTIDYSIP